MKNKEIEELLNKMKNCNGVFDYYLEFGEVDLLLSYIEQLQTNVKDCKQKLEQYENPDDLTLFYMWLDTKAKDKMKQMEAEITNLKQQNSMITKLGEQLQNNRDKAIEYINKTVFNEKGYINFCYELENILKGDGDE